MKTILVIYTLEKLNEGQVRRHLANQKAYAFNTDAKVKVGTLIKTPKYSTPMQVVEVFSTAYKYFNSKTGQVYSKSVKSFFQGTIATLKLQKAQPQVYDGTFY